MGGESEVLMLDLVCVLEVESIVMVLGVARSD